VTVTARTPDEQACQALKKLYCYVDETGQDAASRVFIVVAVVSAEDQEKLRDAIIEIENTAETGRRKWDKSRPARRLHYLELTLQSGLLCNDVFFDAYQKPLPYFFPMLDVLEKAIKAKAADQAYVALILVDGIDRKKASELTNALRLRGVSLELVRSRRDESEPWIRLADMWAGCIREALEGSPAERAILDRAVKIGAVRSTKEKTP
jgi:hypothetical protein